MFLVTKEIHKYKKHFFFSDKENNIKLYTDTFLWVVPESNTLMLWECECRTFQEKRTNYYVFVEVKGKQVSLS